MKSQVFFLYFFSVLIYSCSQQRVGNFGADISSDSAQVISGKLLFERHCSACHSFLQEAIGPNLSGLTHQVETEWIRDFIRNPERVIKSGDARAVSMYDKFKVYMPAFSHLEEVEVDALLSYLHTFKELPDSVGVAGLDDPLPDIARDSELVLDLDFITQIPASEPNPPLAKITKLECEPQSGRLFVHDQRGILYELKDGLHSEYFPLRDHRADLSYSPGLATGFGSYAFHPDFQKNGMLYTSHSEKGQLQPADFSYADSIQVMFQWVLTEWTTANPLAETFEGIGRELLRINFVTQVHGMQEISFNPYAVRGDADYGQLYIGIGDGGSAESGFAFIADHQGSKVWSSILRIDPRGNNSRNGKYGIPPSNPFAQDAGKAGEVYAYGFRNPNRVFWDPEGRLLATEIGHQNVEELNEIKPGEFYGWPLREGSFIINPYGNMGAVFSLAANDALLGSTYPILEMDHDELAAIIGGYFFKSGSLEGRYVFGDVPTGKLFIADMKDQSNIKVEKWKVKLDGKEISLQELCGNKRVDLKFGQDCHGQIYLMTKADGKIYRIRDT